MNGCSSLRYARLFINLLEVTILVDVEPLEIKPTWTNNQVGINGVAKRLDKFILDEELLMHV